MRHEEDRRGAEEATVSFNKKLPQQHHQLMLAVVFISNRIVVLVYKFAYSTYRFILKTNDTGCMGWMR